MCGTSFSRVIVDKRPEEGFGFILLFHYAVLGFQVFSFSSSRIRYKDWISYGISTLVVFSFLHWLEWNSSKPCLLF
ncbi:hypothetical protein B0T17DRAFT_533332 [Bombardia bombarda]|uniref:Uncharacterized protein n=1 Tax=Bombardia bombarda TaxID=252184 RepID=A0AA40C1N8_9PEZI|nr:hypothetical protein B0T17DRAFT_533332 [Bombardia bombarda]